MIDITFDFRSDSKGKDPDAYSPTLNAYHRALWSKELPNGEVMELQSGRAPYARGHGTSIREGSLCLQMEGFLVLE